MPSKFFRDVPLLNVTARRKSEDFGFIEYFSLFWKYVTHTHEYFKGVLLSKISKKEFIYGYIKYCGRSYDGNIGSCEYSESSLSTPRVVGAHFFFIFVFHRLINTIRLVFFRLFLILFLGEDL